MVNLQGVSRAVFIAEPTAVAVNHKASGTLSGPGSGRDVALVGHGVGLSSFLSGAASRCSSIAKMISCVTGRRLRAASALIRSHERGICLPATIAPFQIAIVPMNMVKSDTVRAAVEQLYSQLQTAGIEVLLDDRDERAGVMFADMELIGIPHRIVVGDRGLKDGMVEYQGRRDSAAQSIALSEILAFVSAKLCD